MHATHAMLNPKYATLRMRYASYLSMVRYAPDGSYAKLSTYALRLPNMALHTLRLRYATNHRMRSMLVNNLRYAKARYGPVHTLAARLLRYLS